MFVLINKAAQKSCPIGIVFVAGKKYPLNYKGHTSEPGIHVFSCTVNGYLM
jgi:hypothetical protein